MTKTCNKCSEEKLLSDFGKAGFYKGVQQYQANCRVCRRAMEKGYRQTNKEGVRTKNKKWRDANRETALAATARWHETNKEYSLEVSRQWKRANKDRVKEANNNRRALLKERTREQPTRGYWKKLLSFYGERCMKPGCGATEDLTLDHVVSLNKQGWHEFTNWQILCKPCNSGKRDWHHTDYRDWSRGILADTRRL